MKTIRQKTFDIQRVNLSAEEGFVLSRIVGSVSLSDLVALCGLDEARVMAIVEHLAAQGTVDVEPAVGQALLRDSGSGGSLDVCGRTRVGIVRSNNEDALAVVDLTTGRSLAIEQRSSVEIGPHGILLAVCDGMGGEKAGEVASALTIDVLREHLSVPFLDEDAPAALSAAVGRANDAVVAAARKPGREGMGTTAVAVLIRGANAYTAEVGDSRAYAWRNRRLTQITRDQTYVQVLLDQGLIAPETIKRSAAKNVVLQAIGKAPTLTVAQRRLALRADDVLLLCSDGLSSFVTDAEIAGVLDAAPQLDDACGQLIAMANDRGGKDNVTVVLAHVTAPVPAPPQDEGIAETLTSLREYAVGEAGAES